MSSVAGSECMHVCAYDPTLASLATRTHTRRRRCARHVFAQGDDQMKKTLGEAMIKSRQQQEAGGVDSPSFGS